MSEFEVTGRCACGAVRYTVCGPARSVEHCHCSMCRHAHGALVASGALIARRQLTIDQGEDDLTTYVSSPGNRRLFCRTCGSQLFVLIDHLPDAAYYWAATLDGGAHPGHPPERECHIHWASRTAWERPGDDGLARFDEIPEGVGPGNA